MNHEDLHEKHGQRSAPRSAQKCVSWKATLLNAFLGENHEDQKRSLHHQELECRRQKEKETFILTGKSSQRRKRRKHHNLVQELDAA